MVMEHTRPTESINPVPERMMGGKGGRGRLMERLERGEVGKRGGPADATLGAGIGKAGVVVEEEEEARA